MLLAKLKLAYSYTNLLVSIGHGLKRLEGQNLKTCCKIG